MKTALVMILMFAVLAPQAVWGLERGEVEVGFGTGANIIPFGGLSTDPYQQIFSNGPFQTKFPSATQVEVREIRLSSNQAIAPGVTSVNMVVRMATARAISPNPTLNLGDDQRIVFAGWANTNKKGELVINVRARAFAFNIRTQLPMYQVEVVQATGPGAFLFGPSTDMWRVYTPLGGTYPVVESAGLNTVFVVKAK